MSDRLSRQKISGPSRSWPHSHRRTSDTWTTQPTSSFHLGGSDHFGMGRRFCVNERVQPRARPPLRKANSSQRSNVRRRSLLEKCCQKAASARVPRTLVRFTETISSMRVLSRRFDFERWRARVRRSRDSEDMLKEPCLCLARSRAVRRWISTQPTKIVKLQSARWLAISHERCCLSVSVIAYTKGARRLVGILRRSGECFRVGRLYGNLIDEGGVTSPIHGNNVLERLERAGLSWVGEAG
jgi:hypothetical protein